jgi:C1A family cysteine protease
MFYNPSSKKVFSFCGKNMNHAVLAVGYDENSLEVKNSWGANWGADGYIYLAHGNTCGVYDTMVIVTE